MPPSALAGRPLVSASHLAETSGRIAPGGLSSRLNPSGRRSLRCSPVAAALTPALAAALTESPISAELAAPSERPALGAHIPKQAWVCYCGCQYFLAPYGDHAKDFLR